MLNCLPDFFIDYLMDEYDVNSKSQLKRALKAETEYDEKRSVKVIETEVDTDYYTASDLEDFKESLEYRFDLTEKQLKKITEIARVRVTYKLDGDERNTGVNCIKYDGRWYCM